MAISSVSLTRNTLNIHNLKLLYNVLMLKCAADEEMVPCENSKLLPRDNLKCYWKESGAKCWVQKENKAWEPPGTINPALQFTQEATFYLAGALTCKWIHFIETENLKTLKILHTNQKQLVCYFLKQTKHFHDTQKSIWSHTFIKHTQHYHIKGDEVSYETA